MFGKEGDPRKRDAAANSDGENPADSVFGFPHPT